MTDDDKDNSETYAISGLSKPPETVFTPSNDSDIFAIKKENIDRLDSLIAMALSAGVFLCNAYRLDRRLAQDEMGEIWKASDLKASQNVSVYLPPSEIRKDESACEPILQAAKRVEALDHPRIVPVLENFTDPEHGFFTVRKFVSDTTLDVYRKEYIKQHKKFAPLKAVKIVNDVAHALDYAHSVGIIHGDLCPKNIIVGQDDEVFVDNFALLPVQAESASAERQPYLPPEIAEGFAATAISDVYALAVIAYELLAGQLPYSPETMNDVPLPIPNVPSAVDTVVRKALARDPDDRYDSCGTFVKALETGFQESAKGKPIAKPMKKIARPKSVAHRVLSCVMVFVLLVLGVLLGGGITLLALPKETQDEWIAFLRSVVSGIATEQTELPNEPDVEIITQTEPIISPRPIRHPPIRIEPTPPKVDDVPTTETEPEPEPESPPIIDVPVPPEEPPSVPVSPAVPVWTPPVSPVEVLPEEGEYKSIVVDGDEYRFYWCQPLPIKASGFWILEKPVTPAIWKAIMGKASVRKQPSDGAGVPMRNVSWNECQQFMATFNDKFDAKLNELGIVAIEQFGGYRFSLPTESQWEYAYNKGFLKVYDGETLEWCSNWYDDAKNFRVICGDAHQRNGRDPGLGYDYIGFRLVVVPKDKQE